MDKIAKQQCATCNHQEHELGRCKQCNCGSSELMCSSEYDSYTTTIDFDEHLTRIYNNANTVRYEKGAYKVCR